MNIMVTGAGGQLGRAVVCELVKRGERVSAPSSAELDITNKDSVKRAFKTYVPHAVIHCAAYTNVDKAEEVPDFAYLVNTIGTENLAQMCRTAGAKMLYVSTDYVFDGSGTAFWRPEDRCAPINVYGISKHHGEIAVERCMDNYFIVRTSWIFGCGGNNFVAAILKRGEEQRKVQVVCDQIGSPAYTRDLAELFADMIETDKYGYYHAANEGICSRFELAKEIFLQAEALRNKKLRRLSAFIEPVLTADFGAKAMRPLNSRMDTSKLQKQGFGRLPSWTDALGRYLLEAGLCAEKYHILQ